MSENSIFFAFITIATTLSLAYFSKAVNKQIARNEEGLYVLRMHKIYLVTGIIALVVTTAVAIVPLLDPNLQLFHYIIMFLLILFFGGLGLWSIYYYKRHSVAYDDKQFTVCSELGKIRTIHWNEVKKCKFSTITWLLTIYLKDGSKVKVHSYLVGFPRFVSMLEKQANLYLNLPIAGKL